MIIFRLRFVIPQTPRTKGEAQIIVDTIRLNSKLADFYDGQTIELKEEPKGWIGNTFGQLLGKK